MQPDQQYGQDITSLCSAGTNVLTYRVEIHEQAVADTRFGVCVVQRRSPQQLSSQCPRLSLEQCHKHVRSYFEAAGEVIMVSTTISLHCPLSLSRITTPARARSCTHIQCFDLCSFLGINANSPKFLCPVCSQPAPYTALVVDTLMEAILHSPASANYSEVALAPDGSWVPEGPSEASSEEEQQEEQQQVTEGDNVPEAPHSPEPEHTEGDQPPVIVIDSDQDD